MTAAGIPALLEPIQARLHAATPGPWDWDHSNFRRVLEGKGGEQVLTCAALLYPEKRNQDFIAAAPTDTARLLAAVKAVVAESGEVVDDSEGLGLDFQEDDFDRGYHAARRQTVQQILDVVEAALRSEA